MAIRMTRGTKRTILIVVIVVFFGGAILTATGNLGQVLGYFMARFDRLLSGIID